MMKGFFTTVWEIELAVSCEEQRERYTQKQLAEQSGVSLSNFKRHVSMGRKKIAKLEQNVTSEKERDVCRWYCGFSGMHGKAIHAIVEKVNRIYVPLAHAE